MGNKKTSKVQVNKKLFMEVLKLRNCSIRKLGDAYDEIQRTEKTIRRCLDEGEMPSDLLDNIAKYLDVHPDYLSGFYNQENDKIEDDYLRHLFRKSIHPNRYPYLLKAKSDIDYTNYFESILTMSNITMKQYRTLPAEERVLFRQELVVAILQVISRHFSHDSLGNDIFAELNYCESFVGDFDPFSYFAELEDIGLSEDDIFIPKDNDDSISDFEKMMDEEFEK